MITHETYIIILTSPWYGLELHLNNLSYEKDKPEYVEFYEPDLDDALTAIASLNPPTSFYKKLELLGGGEENGS